MKKSKIILGIACICFAMMAQYETLHAQAYTWGNVAIGGGGFVSGLLTSKNERNLMYCRTDVGGAYKWNSSTSSWSPLLDWVSTAQTGFMGVLSMAIDPNNTNKLFMLAGTSYFNGGKTAILISTNHGSTFTVVDVTSQFQASGNAMGRQNGERLQVDPNNSNVLYCGTQNGGLFRSTNGGSSWGKITSFPVTTTANGNGISFVLLDPNSKGSSTTSQTIYVGVSQMGTTNLYVSKNGGGTWALVSGAPQTYEPQRAAITNGNLYITYANGQGPNGTTNEPMTAGAVWEYKSAVNTWVNVTPATNGHAFSGISIDPNNGQRIIISTINTYLNQYVYNGSTVYGDRILLSTNGGTSWTDIVNGNINLNTNGPTWVLGGNIHWAGSIEFDPFNTARAFVTSGQGVFNCDNVNTSPTTWKFVVDGLEETVPRDIVSVKTGPLATVIYDYTGFLSDDVHDYAPRLTPGGGTNTGIAVAGSNPNVMLRAGGYVYYSLNGGTTWTQCGVTNGGGFGKVAVSANGYAYLHCPDGSSTIYRSVNQGASWTASGGISIANAVPVADISNAQNFYAYNSSTGAFYVSTDRGYSFTSPANIGANGSKIIRSVPDNPGHVWVAMGSGGLMYTQNSGTSFTTVGGNLTSCSAVGFGVAASGATYPTVYIWGVVNGVEGLYRSTNKGVNWTRINDDAHEYGGIGNGQFVIGSMNTYGVVYMSTVGRGVVYGAPTGTNFTNAISPSFEKSVTEVPEIKEVSIKLFPNPIANNTVSAYVESNRAQTVSFRVIGLDGKVITSSSIPLVRGGNKVEIKDGIPNLSGMYILSAFKDGQKEPIVTIKFLKL